MTLTDQQQEIVDYIQLNPVNPKIVLVNSIAGSGKEQPITCVVKTPSGDRQLKDITIGDHIYGADGKLTTVTGIFPQGKKDVYKFTFRDGTTTRAGLNHNWLTYRSNSKPKVRTTKELLEDGICKPCGMHKFKIPLTEPIAYTEKNLPVHPYVLGAFLGDGTFTSNTPALSFHSQDEYIYTKVKSIIEHEHKIPQTSSPRSTSSNGKQVSLNKTQQLLKNFKNNKHVPEEYLRGSISQRLDLLRGLMDTDGCVSRNRVTFSNTNRSLLDAVVVLVQSLGGIAIRYGADSRKCADCYTINVKMPLNPFSLQRKADGWKPSKKNPPSRYVTGIELLDEQEEQLCIMIDNTDHLYLTDNFIVTHNTTLLRAIADVTSGNGLYLAYNKALATNASKKFPNHIDCRTTHSLAYKAMVPTLKLKVGFFGARQVEDRMPYSEKAQLVENIKEFCLSNYLSYDDFAKKHELNDATLANKYLTLMSTGKIECTHDFYLKLFHMYLAEDKIEQVEYDLVLLDEAGDLNEVTLEIFKLLNGKCKVAVGDAHQNIFTFNYTINCFECLKSEGITFNLTQSFRVPENVAQRVEQFCRKYLDPDMIFKGVPVTDTKIKTIGYVSRTNAGLIGKIIELNQERIPYGLVRRAQDIFKVPLMVAGLKYQGKIYDTAYKHIQADVDGWFENLDGVKQQHKTMNAFLRDKYEDDLQLVQSLNLVSRIGKSAVFDTYAEAKNHEGKKQDFMLFTAHSGKGLEFDEVILAPDMNKSLEAIMERFDECTSDEERTALRLDLDTSDKETLNLYYVGITRCSVRLCNAKFLM